VRRRRHSAAFMAAILSTAPALSARAQGAPSAEEKLAKQVEAQQADLNEQEARIRELEKKLAELVAQQKSTRAETPKAGDPAFARVAIELIASNRLAVEAAAKRATELGLIPWVAETPISGEASAVGAVTANDLLGHHASRLKAQTGGFALIWGGETTVSLGDNEGGVGGRCQELALAAARVLKNAPDGLALLAAGTDGRDGPTDAAGAIVDGKTWATIAARGRDPAQDLAAHDAYHALDAAGALLRPGLTGTNVMDIVIGVSTDAPPASA